MARRFFKSKPKRSYLADFGMVYDNRYDSPSEEENTNDVFAADETGQINSAEITALPQRSPAPLVPAQRKVEINKIVNINPRSYNEVKIIGENFREGIPVIMNLCEMEEGEDKRLVDFAAGLIFGLKGNIERISNKVFLLCPHNFVVSAENKESLSNGNGGFYNQS